MWGSQQIRPHFCGSYSSSSLPSHVYETITISDDEIIVPESQPVVVPKPKQPTSDGDNVFLEDKIKSKVFNKKSLKIEANRKQRSKPSVEIKDKYDDESNIAVNETESEYYAKHEHSKTNSFLLKLSAVSSNLSTLTYFPTLNGFEKMIDCLKPLRASSPESEQKLLTNNDISHTKKENSAIALRVAGQQIRRYRHLQHIISDNYWYQQVLKKNEAIKRLKNNMADTRKVVTKKNEIIARLEKKLAETKNIESYGNRSGSSKIPSGGNEEKGTFNNRQIEVHGNSKKFQCSNCKKTFSYAKRCMEHTLLCVGKTNEMASTTPITLTATESRDVKAHVQIQLENKVNKCQSCNKVYSSQALLSKHEKIHDPARWKKCPHCKHKTPYAWTLPRHIEKHHYDESD